MPAKDRDSITTEEGTMNIGKFPADCPMLGPRYLFFLLDCNPKDRHQVSLAPVPLRH